MEKAHRRIPVNKYKRNEGNTKITIRQTVITCWQDPLMDAKNQWNKHKHQAQRVSPTVLLSITKEKTEALQRRNYTAITLAK